MDNRTIEQIRDNETRLIKELIQKENIIKEVREYIENHNKLIRENKMLGVYGDFMIIPKELLEILDKENKE